MDEFMNVSHAFINNISRYIAAFCDLKKIMKVSFIINTFLSFQCPRLALVLKTEDFFQQMLTLKELSSKINT